MLAHNVFFTLADNSPAAQKELVDDCHRYLAAIPGLVFFAAGTCADSNRPVNDRNFHVALHTVVENKAGLEAYLTHPQHVAFAAKHKPNWAQLRVFDSDVTGSNP